tara:strand:- start:189 stop:350 length:162 start_codon:yes stop_codon:yes gene_type:complete
MNEISKKKSVPEGQLASGKVVWFLVFIFFVLAFVLRPGCAYIWYQEDKDKDKD